MALSCNIYALIPDYEDFSKQYHLNDSILAKYNLIWEALYSQKMLVNFYQTKQDYNS